MYFLTSFLPKPFCPNFSTSFILQIPKPKWEAFKVLNLLIPGIFLGSLGYVYSNYRQLMAQASISPLTSMFFPIMIVWGGCLVYFFGFFGISFLDTEELSESPGAFGLEELQQQAQRAADKDRQARLQQNKLTEPRNDAPICAEKPTSTTPKQAAGANELPTDLSGANFQDFSDDQLLELVTEGKLKDHELEKKLGDYERAVRVRRQIYERLLNKKLEAIPYLGYDYDKVFGANCEIVLGYVPIPLGIAGPLLINGKPVFVPMATTEGCLVASTNRGCKAITSSGGCAAVVLKDAITRAPCIRLPSAMRAASVKQWVEDPENYVRLEEAFNSTTNFGRLDSIEATVAGRNVYLRFGCMAGDAMGMNMVSKGCMKALEVLEADFSDMSLVAISGNMCTDKKPAAINWILGRGKSIVVEAIIPESIVKNVLKSTVYDMIEVNKQKCHIGSAMAGSVGGFNAHAANIVTAVFLATGQDPAQNVESSNCITILEYADDGISLHISVTMPSVEVGTVGGGTHLPAQAGCLDICGVQGASRGEGMLPGDNSRGLALIVGSAVLAGELSLLAALASNQLVKSHMILNRKPSAVELPSAVQNPRVRKTASMPELKH